MRFFVRPSFSALLLAGAAAVTGCSDQPVAPLAPASPGASVAEAPRAHMVVFRNDRGIPEGFAERVAALGGAVDATYEKLGIAVVSRLGEEGAAALRGHPGVGFVEADARIAYDAGRRTIIEDDLETADVGAAYDRPPHHAVLYPWQWNMQAIQARTVWEAGFRGSPGVTVAIVDTGIDPTMLDLQDRVDLARSRSFVPEDDAIAAEFFPGSHPATDLDGHGNNVAAQVSSNARHFAGVTSQTTLMAVKVCSIHGYCSFSSIFAGIVHAVDAGAAVINMSLGGAFFRRDCNGCSSIVNRVLRYAEQAGVTVVVAAGNESVDLDRDGNLYVAFCSAPHVICVSATGATAMGFRNSGPFPDIDSPAPYSNFGRSAIGVAAPGGNYKLRPDGSIQSFAWVWSGCSKTQLHHDPATGGFSKTSCSQDPDYNNLTGYIGTSQAAPHVAGLAALLVERLGRNPAQIRHAIEKSADDLGQPGTDPFYGRGRINVARALGL